MSPLASVGFVFGFGYILICNQPDELAFAIDNWQFLDFVLLKNFGGLLEVGGGGCCHQIDTAHGHTKGVVGVLKEIKRAFPQIDVVVGNIATGEAARYPCRDRSYIFGR